MNGRSIYGMTNNSAPQKIVMMATQTVVFAFSVWPLLFCFFALFTAPMLDSHLAEKYGQKFLDYKGRTKRIVPYVD